MRRSPARRCSAPGDALDVGRRGPRRFVLLQPAQVDAHELRLLVLLDERSPSPDRRALDRAPEYLRNAATQSSGVIDYRDWQIPLGRRFRALKLWMVIRHYGVEGLRAYIREHIRIAALFEELGACGRTLLPRRSWRTRTTSLVCFRLRAAPWPREQPADTDAQKPAVAAGETEQFWVKCISRTRCCRKCGRLRQIQEARSRNRPGKADMFCAWRSARRKPAKAMWPRHGKKSARHRNARPPVCVLRNEPPPAETGGQGGACSDAHAEPPARAPFLAGRRCFAGGKEYAPHATCKCAAPPLLESCMIAYELRLNADRRWALSEGSRHFEEKRAVQETLRRLGQRLDRGSACPTRSPVAWRFSSTGIGASPKMWMSS